MIGFKPYLIFTISTVVCLTFRLFSNSHSIFSYYYLFLQTHQIPSFYQQTSVQHVLYYKRCCNAVTIHVHVQHLQGICECPTIHETYNLWDNMDIAKPMTTKFLLSRFLLFNLFYSEIFWDNLHTTCTASQSYIPNSILHYL